MLRKVMICALLCTFGGLRAEYSNETGFKRWEDAARGKNLAAGKKFVFSTEPNYGLTKNKEDEFDLTDGILSKHPRGIWFDKAAVGWYSQEVTQGINLLLDLGKNENIGKVVARIQGGGAQHMLVFPKQIEVYVSKDGKQYYQTADLQKLQPGEMDQSDFIKYYYLPEPGQAYVYPFSLPVNAEARYIILRITGVASFFFTDQIAVIEAENTNSTDFNATYSQVPREVPMDGIQVGPRIGILAIPDNMSAPNCFVIQDLRNIKNRKIQAFLNIELPDAVKLEFPIHKPEEKTGRRHYRFPLETQGKRPQTPMMYFKAEKPLPPDTRVRIYAECGDEPVRPQEFPIQVISMPEVKPPLQGFPIDLTWMGVPAQQDWPDFLRDWHKLGFDAVTCFPRYFRTEKDQERLRSYLHQARNSGYKVVMNESPFYRMHIDLADKSEIFSQLKDGKSNKNLCPSYTGEYYQQELERITGNVRLSKPDRIYWDIECWNNGAADAIQRQCIRCNEAAKTSGLDIRTYLLQCGARILRDLKEAVRKGTDGGPMPLVASYNHQAGRGPHHHLFDGLELFPQYIDQFQPSLYVAGRPALIHKSIRLNYTASNGSRRIFPWLTAGTYGEFEPFNMELMIYEALLNGAEGFGYYWFGDFDTPLDFYYHAKALATLAPYQDILKHGKVRHPQGSNPDLLYSMIENDKGALLLVGNYQKNTGDTMLKLPFVPKTVRDLRNAADLPATQDLQLNVPKGQALLLYITQE